MNKQIPILVLIMVLVFSMTAFASPIEPLTITSPVGGEIWQGGIMRTITWTYNPLAFKSQNVQILLLKGNDVAATIAPSVPVGSHGKGSFLWSTLNVNPGTDYRIKIVGTTGGISLSKLVQSDTSKYFSITAKAKITITFPQAVGQTLHPGQAVTITWDYTGDIGSTLFLRLVHNSDPPHGGLFAVLVNAKAPAGSGGQGSYSWVIPSKVDGIDIPASSTYSFDIGCEYAGVGASGKSFRIAKFPLIRH